MGDILNKDKQKIIGEQKHEHKFKTITHFSESCFYMFTEQLFLWDNKSNENTHKEWNNKKKIK